MNRALHSLAYTPPLTLLYVWWSNPYPAPPPPLLCFLYFSLISVASSPLAVVVSGQLMECMAFPPSLPPPCSSSSPPLQPLSGPQRSVMKRKLWHSSTQSSRQQTAASQGGGLTPSPCCSALPSVGSSCFSSSFFHSCLTLSLSFPFCVAS